LDSNSREFQNGVAHLRLAVNARWSILVILLVLSLISQQVFSNNILPFLQIIGIVFIYNLAAAIAYLLLSHKAGGLQHNDLKSWTRYLNLVMNFQVVLDILVITIGVYLTGGISSLLIPVFLVYLPVTNLLLTGRGIFLQTMLAVFFINIILWGEFLGIFSPNQFGIGIYDPSSIYSLDYVATTSIFLSLLLWLAVLVTRKIISHTERTRRQAELLRRMAAAFGSTLEANELIDRVLEYTGRIVPCDAAAVLGIDEDNLRIINWKGFNISKPMVSLREVAPFLLQPRANNRIRKLLTSKELEFWKLGEKSPSSGTWAHMIVREKMIGAVLIARAGKKKFTKEEMFELQTIADHAALTVENARLYDETRRLAHTDGLTGIYNRRFFDQKIREEFHRSLRHGHNFSLLICDLDNFKNYNDRYGHLAGDDLLVELSLIMKSNLRVEDLVFRYGGEEFAILLPQTDMTGAQEIAERLRRAIEVCLFRIAGTKETGRITISIGVATFPQDAKNTRALVDKADRALYIAKTTRNRVAIYPNEVNKVRGNPNG
jgi:diguanylate cyclase (GGDEF)-like protein